MPNPVEQPPAASAGPGEPGRPVGRVRIDVAALSHRGKVRDVNEDAYFVCRIGRYLERLSSSISEDELPSRFDQAGYLMVVADGLGGHEAGDVASRSALITALQLVLRAPKWALKLDDPATREGEIRELLGRSGSYLASVHAALRRQAAGDSQLAGMGTTFTGVYCLGSDVFVMHVGDSKVFVAHEGAMRKITRDHTVAQQYADLGAISQEEVATHRMHHVLTRAVGGPDDELEGDLHHLNVAHGDRLLLCSDGLTDMASEDEISAIVAARPQSEDACQALVELALQRGGHDNVTVIVAGFAMD